MSLINALKNFADGVAKASNAARLSMDDLSISAENLAHSRRIMLGTPAKEQGNKKIHVATSVATASHSAA